jgi:NAD(P)H-hydrate epimerase
VRAEVTCTFIALKQGLVTGLAPECVGVLELADLEVPGEVYAAATPTAQRLPATPYLGRRARGANKGQYGHVLVVGGSPGFAGAVRLTAEAALRCGAGLVSVATAPECVPLITAGRPEIMVHAIRTADELAPLLARATVIAVGPGLGQGAWGRALFSGVREARVPLVVDADALNLLAADRQYRDDWCLTPHPGEAARLLGDASAAVVNRDRYAAVRSLQATFGGVVVLKGAGSLVDDGRCIGVVAAGNPGMASGGMGDVLTGVIAALIAQGLEPGNAARTGASLHAVAADRAAARDGERGLLASDLLTELRHLVN